MYKILIDPIYKTKKLKEICGFRNTSVYMADKESKMWI